MTRMRILVADNQPRVRSALRLLLEHQLKTKVVGDAGSAGELIEQITSKKADLIFLDWELTGMKPEELVPAVRKLNKGVVIIAMGSHPELRTKAIAEGANDFVSKSDPPERLLEVLNKCRCNISCPVSKFLIHRNEEKR